MLSKSALVAAVAGGVTTAMVIAMASGLSPKGAHADPHTDPQTEAHGAGHEAGHEAGHDGSESHGAAGHEPGGHDAGGHVDGHGGVAGVTAGHDDQPHAPAKPAPTPPAKPAPGKAADPHAAPTTPAADPHGAAKAEPAAKPDAHASAPAPAAPAAEGHGGAKADPHAASTTPAADSHAGSVAGSSPEAEAALKMLQEGNERWVASQTTNPNTDAARRKDVADNGQKPFVTVLTCADSRLPVERIVDRGVGEVFTVRVAGAIAGVSETGTVEYGLEHLHTPLLVVMGHSKCGAVAAAAAGADVHGKIKDIVEAIEPAVERAKRKNPGLEGAELNAAAVKENVWQTVFGLMRESKEIRTLVGQGKVKVVGAVCDVSTGKIEWLGEHPWQQELIDALGGVATAEKDGGHGK